MHIAKKMISPFILSRVRKEEIQTENVIDLKMFLRII